MISHAWRGLRNQALSKSNPAASGSSASRDGDGMDVDVPCRQWPVVTTLAHAPQSAYVVLGRAGEAASLILCACCVRKVASVVVLAAAVAAATDCRGLHPSIDSLPLFVSDTATRMHTYIRRHTTTAAAMMEVLLTALAAALLAAGPAAASGGRYVAPGSGAPGTVPLVLQAEHQNVTATLDQGGAKVGISAGGMLSLALRMSSAAGGTACEDAGRSHIGPMAFCAAARNPSRRQ